AEAVADPRLRAVLLRALDTDPTRRFPDATAFRLALEGLPRGSRPGPAEDHAFSSQSVVTFYPSPVAVPFRRFVGPKEPVPRLLALFAAAEALARYLVTLAVADLFGCLGRSGADAALPADAAFDLLRRPMNVSFGGWLAALRAAAVLAGRG